jgi:predicted acetyltransferase
MAELPTLSATGIVLRPLSVGDAEALFSAHGDTHTHEYWSSPAHKSVEETVDYIRATLGRIGLFVEREGMGEIGIIMRPEATGRGLASKALALVIEHGFGALDLHRIGADIDPDNNASMSLFLRAGFQREGLLRGNWKTHQGVRDSVIMAKLRD